MPDVITLQWLLSTLVTGTGTYAFLSTLFYYLPGVFSPVQKRILALVLSLLLGPLAVYVGSALGYWPWALERAGNAAVWGFMASQALHGIELLRRDA